MTPVRCLQNIPAKPITKKQILVIGDSIADPRGAYEGGWARFIYKHALVVPPQNAATSAYTLTNIAAWIALAPTPDIILWNNGIWEIAAVEADETPAIAAYKANLEDIATALLATGADVYFLTTTPESPIATPGTVDVINTAALEVMAAESIPIVDLHEFCVENLDDSDFSLGVHWTNAAAVRQAAFIVSGIGLAA